MVKRKKKEPVFTGLEFHSFILEGPPVKKKRGKDVGY